MLAFIKVRLLYLAFAAAALSLLPGVFAAFIFGKYAGTILSLLAPGTLAWTCMIVSIAKDQRERAKAGERTRLTLERLRGVETEHLRRRDLDILARLMAGPETREDDASGNRLRERIRALIAEGTPSAWVSTARLRAALGDDDLAVKRPVIIQSAIAKVLSPDGDSMSSAWIAEQINQLPTAPTDPVTKAEVESTMMEWSRARRVSGDLWRISRCLDQ